MNKNSLVIYKTQPAVIKELDGDKYIIMYGKQEQKVREKDIVLLFDGAVWISAHPRLFSVQSWNILIISIDASKLFGCLFVFLNDTALLIVFKRRAA